MNLFSYFTPGFILVFEVEIRSRSRGILGYYSEVPCKEGHIVDARRV